jgi:transposase
MDSCKLRLVHVYKEDENKVIEIITNNLDWAASTIAALYKRRWEIELFFKALKQNLKVKTFWGTSENAVRSQIFVALIVYLLTELVRRAIVKGEIAYSTLIERLRMCMAFYLSLDYVCNHIGDGAKKAKIPEQQKMDFSPNLFT